MKKSLGIIGGLTLISSISGNIVSCSKPEFNYIFELKSERGEIIGSFDRRELEDYYFELPPHWDYEVINIVVNLKNKELQKYWTRYGPTEYWLRFMVEGLGLSQKPAQDKYDQKPIPEWA